MKRIIMSVCLSGLVCLGACRHSPPEVLAPLPADELYRQAMEYYSKNNYIDAYETFQTCRTRYPISEWGIKAGLKMADSLYFQKQYPSALTQYQEFVRLHPTHEYSDYVQYQIGMCNYEQLCTIDRDQTFAREAAKQFERFVSLFPTSPYVPSALEKVEECKRNIAEHVLYIGNFYYRTGNYTSALHRYQEAMNVHLRYLPEPEQLLFQQGKTYLRLEKPEQAQESFARVVAEYPDSSYAALSKTLLEDPKKIKEIEEVGIVDVFWELYPF